MFTLSTTSLHSKSKDKRLYWPFIWLCHGIRRQRLWCKHWTLASPLPLVPRQRKKLTHSMLTQPQAAFTPNLVVHLLRAGRASGSSVAAKWRPNSGGDCQLASPHVPLALPQSHATLHTCPSLGISALWKDWHDTHQVHTFAFPVHIFCIVSCWRPDVSWSVKSGLPIDFDASKRSVWTRPQTYHTPRLPLKYFYVRDKENVEETGLQSQIKQNKWINEMKWTELEKDHLY